MSTIHSYFQKCTLIYDVNMGCGGSKEKKKRLNKDIDKNKVCKVGLTLRRGNINVEGCLKTEYYGKTRKKYLPIKEPLPPIKEEESIEEIKDV